MQVQIKCVSFEIDNVESVVRNICELGNEDCDFNGENGSEYLWGCADGFESNKEYTIDYLINKYKNETNIENCLVDIVSDFLNMWMGNDSYYNDYTFQITETCLETVVAIAYTID